MSVRVPYTGAVPRQSTSLTTDLALEGEPVWADSADPTTGDQQATGADRLAAESALIAGREGRDDTWFNGADTLAPDVRPAERRRPERGAPVRPLPVPPTSEARPVLSPVAPSASPPTSVEQRRPVEDRPLDRVSGRRSSRRGRRVKRIVRRIDLWSVLKLSLVLYVCLYAAALLAVAGLWAFINSAGLIDRFESFMKDVGFDRFQFHGSEMFRGVAAGGAILVLASALMTVIAFGLFNAVSELTGGLRLTVIEEDLASPRSRRKRSKANRSQAGQPGSDR